MLSSYLEILEKNDWNLFLSKLQKTKRKVWTVLTTYVYNKVSYFCPNFRKTNSKVSTVLSTDYKNIFLSKLLKYELKIQSKL